MIPTTEIATQLWHTVRIHTAESKPNLTKPISGQEPKIKDKATSYSQRRQDKLSFALGKASRMKSVEIL